MTTRLDCSLSPSFLTRCCSEQPASNAGLRKPVGGRTTTVWERELRFMKDVDAELIHDMQNTATVLHEAAIQLHENRTTLPP